MRPVRIGTQLTLNMAIEVMQTWGMRHLPVTNSNDEIIGLISERNLQSALASGSKGNDPVTDIMIKNPYCVQESAQLADVAHIMADQKYGSAVIIDDQKKVLGIFTTVDALNVLSQVLKSKDQDFQMSHYLDQKILKP